MNWQHLLAFVWLRWRLAANQWRRGGAVNAALMTIVAVGAIVMAVPLFFASVALGLFAFSDAAPAHLLYAWDGVVAGFLVFWTIGLMAELQRTDTLSLSKFLHLPVSVGGAFLINYTSSLLCLSLTAFAPVFIGLGLGLVLARGTSLLLVLPLSAAFLLMVTALTYQFQGWLASLMSNPRRRRTIIVAATAIFVLIFQVPNLLNVVRPWGAPRGANPSTTLAGELAALDRAFESHEFEAAEHLRRQQDVIERHRLATEQARRDRAEYFDRTAKIMNLVLPVGWLPMGVMAAAEGRIGPAFLGFLGMTLVGAASLWRAYRTTVRMYQGQLTARKGAPAAASPAKIRKPSDRLLETRLSGLSEPVSAIVLAGLRALVRAPETKMLLLTPLLLGVALGSMLLKLPGNLPDSARPLAAIGAMVVTLFGAVQLMGNQFGFDRDGFRVFVLCAAPRRDILLGKNLAFVPLAAGMAAVMVIIVEVVCPMRLEHLLSMVPQFVSMFLSFCLLANVMSIYAPMPIAAGSLKPAKPKLTLILLQIVMFMFLFPFTQAPTLLPLGIEAVLEWQGWTAGAPICLMLALAECAGLVFIYRVALNVQGSLLLAREQRILEIVTSHAT